MNDSTPFRRAADRPEEEYPFRRTTDRLEDRPRPGLVPGQTMMAAAWASLKTARAEAVDIQLRNGPLISGVIAVRVEGPVAEVSIRAGHWTHLFPLDEVQMVHIVPRGGAPLR